jgi:hypothetical protein
LSRFFCVNIIIYNISFAIRVLYNDYISSVLFFSLDLRYIFLNNFFGQSSLFKFRVIRQIGPFFSSFFLREIFFIDLFFSIYVFYLLSFFKNTSNVVFDKNGFIFFVKKMKGFINVLKNSLTLDVFFKSFAYNLFFIYSFFFFVRHPRVFLLKKIKLYFYRDLYKFFFSHYLFALHFLVFCKKIFIKYFFTSFNNFSCFNNMNFYKYFFKAFTVSIIDFFSMLLFKFTYISFNALGLRSKAYLFREFSRVKSVFYFLNIKNMTFSKFKLRFFFLVCLFNSLFLDFSLDFKVFFFNFTFFLF